MMDSEIDRYLSHPPNEDATPKRRVGYLNALIASSLVRRDALEREVRRLEGLVADLWRGIEWAMVENDHARRRSEERIAIERQERDALRAEVERLRRVAEAATSVTFEWYFGIAHDGPRMFQAAERLRLALAALDAAEVKK